MDIKNVLNLLNTSSTKFEIYERRKGKHQLMAPFLHEDGDMVDLYLQNSSKGNRYIRICDFGMSLMRLSYNYDINTKSKSQILESMLDNNGVTNDNGNLFLDTPVDKIYEGILQFVGCVQKVCSMDYWGKETVQSVFYEDLKKVILNDFNDFKPQPDIELIPEIIKVDWKLEWKNHDFYLFGIVSKDKAHHAAIALLEFMKAEKKFISLVVHENKDKLGSKEENYLTRNADKQYPKLNDFTSSGKNDIKRLAA